MELRTSPSRIGRETITGSAIGDPAIDIRLSMTFLNLSVPYFFFSTLVQDSHRGLVFFKNLNGEHCILDGMVFALHCNIATWYE
jgi:hypothetical protein